MYTYITISSFMCLYRLIRVMNVDEVLAVVLCILLLLLLLLLYTPTTTTTTTTTVVIILLVFSRAAWEHGSPAGKWLLESFRSRAIGGLS